MTSAKCHLKPQVDRDCLLTVLSTEVSCEELFTRLRTYSHYVHFLSRSDITLRYKETRRRKQEGPVDRERPLGNGSMVTPSGRSKLNGSSDTTRQRKSWRGPWVKTGWWAADGIGCLRVDGGEKAEELWHKDTWRKTDGHMYSMCCVHILVPTRMNKVVV